MSASASAYRDSAEYAQARLVRATAISGCSGPSATSQMRITLAKSRSPLRDLPSTKETTPKTPQRPPPPPPPRPGVVFLFSQPPPAQWPSLVILTRRAVAVREIVKTRSDVQLVR